MRLAVGYQEPENGEEFAEIVADYREDIAELYFAWPGWASGRPALGKGEKDLGEAEERLAFNLKETRRLGVKADLLFNAACYGAKAVSKELEREVARTVEKAAEASGGLEIATTSSLAIAWILKRKFPQLEVRASVNMKIPDAESFSYVAELFDSFHVQRDVQRNLERLRETKRWCEANGKKLCLLANSGCLRNCPGQLFHDNLVAHDAEIAENEPLEGFVPHVCWSLLGSKERWDAVLKGSWIRPEDLKPYAEAVDIVKLATRQHAKPRMAIHAYSSGSFAGNLLDLFEPTYSMAFAPYSISNGKFPASWLGKTSSCKGNCEACGYCKALLPGLLEKP